MQQPNLRQWMNLVESPEANLREPHTLTIWDDAERYPWGPLGENQRAADIKVRARKYAEQHAIVKTVTYQHLIAIEPTVYAAKVEHYHINPSDELPFVFKHNGKLILWDGTHRVTARMKAGHTRGPAEVADLDAVLTPQGQVKHPDQFRST